MSETTSERGAAPPPAARSTPPGADDARLHAALDIFHAALAAIVGYASILKQELAGASAGPTATWRYADAIERAALRAAERLELLGGPGGGATPAGQPAQAGTGPKAPAAPTAARSAAARPTRVLVVDDQTQVRETLRSILAEEGYAVHLARSGEEALEVLAAAPGAVDLVILDLSLPGLGGAEVLRRLSASAAPPRVLLSSGFADELAALAPRAAGVLAKPFTIDQLLGAVRTALRSALP